MEANEPPSGGSSSAASAEKQTQGESTEEQQQQGQEEASGSVTLPVRSTKDRNISRPKVSIGCQTEGLFYGGSISSGFGGSVHSPTATPRPTNQPPASGSSAGSTDATAVGSTSVKIEDATLRITINDFSKLGDTLCSESKIVNGVPWRIMVMPKQHTVNKRNQKCMGFFLQCCPEATYSDAWSVNATAEMRMLSHIPSQPHFTRKTTHTYTSKENDWGYSCFMTWADIVDEHQGYIKNDKVTLEITVKAEPPKNMMDKEEFLRKINQWFKLAEMHLEKGKIDLSIEANNQALKFCKDKDRETKEMLEEQKERIVNQKLIESIQRIEKGKDAPKPTEALKPTSLRQALTGAQKTLSGKLAGKVAATASKKPGNGRPNQQMAAKKKDLAAQPPNAQQQKGNEAKKEGETKTEEEKKGNCPHHGNPQKRKSDEKTISTQTPSGSGTVTQQVETQQKQKLLPQNQSPTAPVNAQNTVAAASKNKRRFSSISQSNSRPAVSTPPKQTASPTSTSTIPRTSPLNSASSTPNKSSMHDRYVLECSDNIKAKIAESAKGHEHDCQCFMCFCNTHFTPQELDDYLAASRANLAAKHDAELVENVFNDAQSAADVEDWKSFANWFMWRTKAVREKLTTATDPIRAVFGDDSNYGMLTGRIMATGLMQGDKLYATITVTQKVETETGYTIITKTYKTDAISSDGISQDNFAKNFQIMSECSGEDGCRCLACITRGQPYTIKEEHFDIPAKTGGEGQVQEKSSDTRTPSKVTITASPPKTIPFQTGRLRCDTFTIFDNKELEDDLERKIKLINELAMESEHLPATEELSDTSQDYEDKPGELNDYGDYPQLEWGTSGEEDEGEEEDETTAAIDEEGDLHSLQASNKESKFKTYSASTDEFQNNETLDEPEMASIAIQTDELVPDEAVSHVSQQPIRVRHTAGRPPVRVKAPFVGELPSDTAAGGEGAELPLSLSLEDYSDESLLIQQIDAYEEHIHQEAWKEEQRRITEFVATHFSLDASVFPADMKISDEMMHAVSTTVNKLMHEKLQMINEDHGMCCLAAGLFYVLAKRVIDSSAAFIGIVESGLVPNISDIHCLFATMCSLSNSIKDSGTETGGKTPAALTGDKDAGQTAKQKQQLLQLLSQQKTSVVAQKAAAQRQQETGGQGKQGGGRRIAKARRRVSPAVGRLSRGADADNDDSENEDEELTGVTEEDLLVPRMTREFFDTYTRQDVMEMLKARIQLMKENPLNKTPGLRAILIQLYKYIQTLTTVCEHMELLEQEATRAKDSMVAIDGSKILEQFNANEKRVGEMEKRCQQMKQDMQKEADKIKKIEQQYNAEKAKHKAESEAKEQLQQQLKDVRKQLTKAEKKNKQDENRINTLQQENSEYDEKLKNLKKEFEAFKKKAADERNKSKKDMQQHAETLKRMEQELGEREAERDRERQANEEAYKQHRQKEQKWDRERRNYSSQLSSLNAFVERAKTAECQLMEAKFTAQLILLQKARDEAAINLAEAEDNLKKATTHADMELMRRSVTEWTAAVGECDSIVQTQKHAAEQALESIRRGTKTMANCIEEIKIPELPIMPKIVRLPPVQVVAPVAPVIPPQGVIGQPRTQAQQTRMQRDSSPHRQQSSSPSSPLKTPQFAPSSANSTASPQPSLPQVSANANFSTTSRSTAATMGTSAAGSTAFFAGVNGNASQQSQEPSPWSWGSGLEFNRLDVVRQAQAQAHAAVQAQQHTQSQGLPTPIGTARQQSYGSGTTSSVGSSEQQAWSGTDIGAMQHSTSQRQHAATGWTSANNPASTGSWNPMSGSQHALGILGPHSSHPSAHHHPTNHPPPPQATHHSTQPPPTHTQTSMPPPGWPKNFSAY